MSTNAGTRLKTETLTASVRSCHIDLCRSGPWSYGGTDLGSPYPSDMAPARPCLTVVLLSALLAAVPAPAAASDRLATSNVVMTAQVSARTSLRVSARVLSFEVSEGADQAQASVEFSAAARTRAGGEIVLTIEPDGEVAGPLGGPAAADAAVGFVGEGPGALSGELLPAAPALAGRWAGSGARSGRLTFTLRAAAPGIYTVPIRIVLSTP